MLIQRYFIRKSPSPLSAPFPQHLSFLFPLFLVLCIGIIKDSFTCLNQNPREGWGIICITPPMSRVSDRDPLALDMALTLVRGPCLTQVARDAIASAYMEYNRTKRKTQRKPVTNYWRLMRCIFCIFQQMLSQVKDTKGYENRKRDRGSGSVAFLIHESINTT